MKSPVPAFVSVPPSRVRAVMTALGVYALVGSALSLLGWVLDLPRLTDWAANGISIQPNTCVATMACGLGILLLAHGYRRAPAALGIVVALVGLTVWVQNVFGANLGIDALLLFDRAWGGAGTLVPGRMGPPGSTAFALLGTSLFLAATGRPTGKRRSIALTLAIVAASISAFSLIGYLYGASTLYKLPQLTTIAAQTATFILALAGSLIVAHDELPPVRWFAEESSAGALARRTLPLVLVVPILLGWLRVRGQDLGWYNSAFGTSILVLVLVGLLIALLAWNVSRISRFERERLQSEERVVDVLESVNEGFARFDSNWRYTFINGAAERMMGKSRADVLGKSVWDLFPESVGRVSYREMHRSMTERIALEFEDYNPRMNCWLACKTYPMGEDGLSIFFQDVTARRGAAEEVRRSRELLEIELADMSRLQELSVLLVKTGDMNTLLRKILAAAAAVLATTKGNIQFLDPVAGRLRIVVHQGHGTRFLDHFADAGCESTCDLVAKTGRRVVVEDVSADAALAGRADLEVILADGIRALQSTPLVSRDGQVLGVLSNHFPEPRRLTERELRYLDLLARMAADFIERTQAERLIREGDQRKNEFLAILAHELRNPLTPVRNAAHLLQLKDFADPDVARPIAMIERHSGLMARLIDDLLDVSRITRGVLELRLEPLDFAEIAREVLESCQDLLESRAHSLRVVLPAEPMPLKADRHRLVQAFANLFANAAKYTPSGGLIEFTTKVEGAMLEASVKDSGVGIPRERLGEIFDLFTQLDRSLGRQGGLGIGLTLAKQLVTLHGGTLEARSEGAGQGSTFSVRLPLAATVREKKEAPSLGEALPNRRILLADDNRDAAESLALILRRKGHDVRVAFDGEEVLAIAAEFRPEVAFLDIGMPRMDGFEAAARMRQESWGKEVFLVALTGWGMPADRERSGRSGFDAHVVKPASPDTLQELLQEMHARAKQGTPAI